LGQILAEHSIPLIYGGGRLGLMGEVSDSVLAAGGNVVGVIPQHLIEMEVAHHGVSDLVVVDGMHSRKRRMFDLSDAFIVLPGGLGTLDELFEILTWKQLRLHSKPVILVNTKGYWDPLLTLTGHLVSEGFARSESQLLFQLVESVTEALPAILRELAGQPELF